MPMKNPPHPGLSVRLDCLEPFGLSVTRAAEVLGVTRQTLNNLVNGKAGISPEMAIRLAKAFGSSAEIWLGMQMAVDPKTIGEIAVRRTLNKRLIIVPGLLAKMISTVLRALPRRLFQIC